MAMMDSLSALAHLTSNVADPGSTVQGYLQRQARLEEMKRNLAMSGVSRDERGHVTSGFASGASPVDVEQLQSDITEDPDLGEKQAARVSAVQDQNAQDVRYGSPEATQQRGDVLAETLAKVSAPNQAKAAGDLAVQQEDSRSKMDLQNNKLENTKRLLQTLQGGGGAGGAGGAGGTGGGMAGPGGSIKPTINAEGGVSFTTTPMPALVQRARNQLMDARDKTVAALHETEKLYPGINQSAMGADVPVEGGGGLGSALGRMFGAVTGIGAPKYGGPSDRAAAGVERANYSLGVATPFSGLAQDASFGNIEQMAGQLPGVRGLATITPLFKEHQSRWGHEAPLATVQRLRHMVTLMNGTLHTLDTSGAGADDGSDILAGAVGAQ